MIFLAFSLLRLINRSGIFWWGVLIFDFFDQNLDEVANLWRWLTLFPFIFMNRALRS